MPTLSVLKNNYSPSFEPKISLTSAALGQTIQKSPEPRGIECQNIGEEEPCKRREKDEQIHNYHCYGKDDSNDDVHFYFFSIGCGDKKLLSSDFCVAGTVRRVKHICVSISDAMSLSFRLSGARMEARRIVSAAVFMAITPNVKCAADQKTINPKTPAVKCVFTGVPVIFKLQMISGKLMRSMTARNHPD